MNIGLNVYKGQVWIIFMVKKLAKIMGETYTLSCKDIGSEDCGFSVTTHSIDEVKKAIFAHARYAHPDKVQDMTEEQKESMLEMIDKKFSSKKI